MLLCAFQMILALLFGQATGNGNFFLNLLGSLLKSTPLQ